MIQPVPLVIYQENPFDIFPYLPNLYSILPLQLRLSFRHFPLCLSILPQTLNLFWLNIQLFQWLDKLFIVNAQTYQFLLWLSEGWEARIFAGLGILWSVEEVDVTV